LDFREIRRFCEVGFRHRGLVGEAQGAREIRAHAWAERLAEGLRRAGKTAAAAQGDRKSAPWKVALAAELKRETQVPNRWLAEQLHMGSGTAVSHYVSRWRRISTTPS
jgi:putative transposase